MNNFGPERFGKLTKTRFSDSDVQIYVTKITNGVWQCVVAQDGMYSQTGEQCATKFECFTCALPKVAQSWGFSV